jgi:excisionase family DNA binding protein
MAPKLDETHSPGTEVLGYDVDTAARAANLSRSTLYTLIASGDLPIVKIGKRTIIRPAALEAMLKRFEKVA